MKNKALGLPAHGQVDLKTYLPEYQLYLPAL